MGARSRVSAQLQYEAFRSCRRQEGGLSRRGHPARKRGVGGIPPPVRGSQGAEPPLGGMEGGTAPSRGERGRPPPQRVLRRDNSSPPSGVQICVSFPHTCVFPPSCRNGTSALAVGKKAACPGCNPSALAVGKKAACPARPRAGSSCRGHPARKRGVGGTLSPVRGARGQSPLPGGVGEAAPAASPENRQLLPAARRADNVGFPCILACSRPAAGTELPLLP